MLCDVWGKQCVMCLSANNQLPQGCDQQLCHSPTHSLSHPSCLHLYHASSAVCMPLRPQTLHIFCPYSSCPNTTQRHTNTHPHSSTPTCSWLVPYSATRPALSLWRPAWPGSCAEPPGGDAPCSLASSVWCVGMLSCCDVFGVVQRHTCVGVR